MLSGQLVFVPNFLDNVPKTILWPPFGNIMDVSNLKQASTRFKHQVLLKRRKAVSLSLLSTSSQVKLQVTSNTAVAPSFLKGNTFEDRTLSDQAFLYGEEEEDDDDDEFSVGESETEMLRRKRIGLANKGKIPWNKGITHNDVTRQKIKQRTIEALSNPKVRKKMSECFRDRSDECKKKISVALRHVWAKRLNYPRQREEFHLSWFESIALAAKNGSKDQKELEWDSYTKMAEELARQKQQQELHEVKAKVKAVLRGKRNMNSKTKEFSAVGRGGSGHVIEENPKKKVKRKKSTKRDIEEEIVAVDESNLQSRLLKMKKPTTVTIEADTLSFLSWEKLDLEYVKRENRRKVSLADQIQAAKRLREKALSNSPCSD